jgi:imidazole glycerol-phosphate synthase subunit HisH
MITVIDYGLGNIQAFVNAYSRLNIQVKVSSSVNDLEGTTKIILPGVGAFDHAMQKLNSSGMRDYIEHLVLDNKIPILGICVGMQMLANSSEEGQLPGLGLIDGTVKKFDRSTMIESSNLPHMGWNMVIPKTDKGLFKDMDTEKRFYFLHSYFFECNKEKNILATTEYGYNFTCAVKKNNILGVQFHPEKSHHFGVQLLKNYSEI